MEGEGMRLQRDWAWEVTGTKARGEASERGGGEREGERGREGEGERDEKVAGPSATLAYIAISVRTHIRRTSGKCYLHGCTEERPPREEATDEIWWNSGKGRNCESGLRELQSGRGGERGRGRARDR